MISEPAHSGPVLQDIPILGLGRRQVVLRNLVMPEYGGRYVYLSEGLVLEFRNKECPKFMRQLEEDIREEILRIAKEKGNTVFTADSTPQGASRYSGWADFNAHYGIRMAKVHIIMADGMIVSYCITNGNAGDGPGLKRLLDGMGDIWMKVLFGHFPHKKSIFDAQWIMSTGDGAIQVFQFDECSTTMEATGGQWV